MTISISWGMCDLSLLYSRHISQDTKWGASYLEDAFVKQASNIRGSGDIDSPVESCFSNIK